MPRIPDEQLDRLKQDISLQRLVEARGIELKRHGQDLIGHCPFHDDKTPSLVISPKQNLWHCLGACQAGGSVIDWVMKSEGVSFRHAVELLQADYAPSALAAGSGPVKKTTVPKLPITLESSAEDARLLAQVIDYYHQTLKQSPEALAYLERRGIANAEAIEHFKLGYANRTLGYRLPAKNRQEGAALRGQLQGLGLYRASGHEHLSGSLIIPVIDSGAGETAAITEVYGRKINDHLRKGTPKHLYLPGPHRGVWNAEALSAAQEIILCESLIDALTFWCAGFRHVTASFGVEGFTADHLAAFKAHGTERVLIAYDRDKAGDAAAEKLARQLNAAGIDAYRLQFPHGLDANEYALQVKPAAKSLGVVIRSAVWLGNGKAQPVTTASASSGAKSPADAEPLHPLAAKTKPRNEALEAPAAASAVDTEKTPEPALPAAAVPPAPRSPVEAEGNERELIVHQGERGAACRRYRIRGLDKNSGLDSLKINLLVARESPSGEGDLIHVDRFDLYQQRPRAAFIKQAAIELGVAEEVIKADLGRVLLACEARQEQLQHAAQSPKMEAVTLTDTEMREALALLKAPDLLERIQHDFERCGIVGETSNALVGYLAAVSRHLERPLAVLIQSTSAAGKSSLMDAVLAFMPAETCVRYSALTGQSLFYMGQNNLKHKILAIAEQQGAEHASYALKLLQSEGELTIASTGKDETTGQLVTKEYRVEGPVMLLLTTTEIEIDEELLNRCLVLSVNESREQTQAIHQRQRQQQTLQGLLQHEERQHLSQLHRNAQRLLKPLKVANPFAEQLSFIDDKTRTRRDHLKYLTLIRAIALLHQYQRPLQTVAHRGQTLAYIEVTRADIETANRLAHEVLGRSLSELPPHTLTLLQQIHTMVSQACAQQGLAQQDYRFSRREIRDYTGCSDGQLKIHCARLSELEYLLIHRGGRGQRLVYELLYDGSFGLDKHLMGLLDVEQLHDDDTPPCGYDSNRSGPNPKQSGQKEQLSGPSQGQVSPKSGPSQGTEKPVSESKNNALSTLPSKVAETAKFSASHAPSYRSLSTAS